jgi:hypothetical protein
MAKLDEGDEAAITATMAGSPAKSHDHRELVMAYSCTVGLLNQ